MTTCLSAEHSFSDGATGAGGGVGVHERDWQRLVEQLRNGDCTPFLGAGASSATLPTGEELSRTWANDYEYPFTDGSNLPSVMQYASVVEQDPVTVKQRLTDQLSRAAEPDFTDPREPHALLARLPISVYLTTNYDDYMKRALERAGKRPTAAVCPWYRGADTDPGTSLQPEYQPRSDEPLVYHLHGSLRYPASLVLAEQDYVEFLIRLMEDRGMDARRILPIQVLPALTRKPLLFIGYSLRDWSFRMLFHGFVQPVASVQRRRHVSVQLTPSGIADDKDGRRRAEVYLSRHYEQLNISVFWGSAAEFCGELSRRLESA
jgi:hypothetical protein